MKESHQGWPIFTVAKSFMGTSKAYVPSLRLVSSPIIDAATVPVDFQDNVLISQDRRALLADFGIARLLSNGVTIAGTTNFNRGTRWMAPELLASAGLPREHQLHTNETDIWAFGMTAYVRSECHDKVTSHSITISGSDISRDSILQPSR